MLTATSSHKVTLEHLGRKALVYVRQSSERQVQQNLESQRLQYGLADRARALGWNQVEVIDTDLGQSAGPGSARAGFDRLIASVALGEVGIVFSREASRLSRTDRDWCHLMEVCGLFDTLIGDAEHIYDLSLMDDQLVMGIKGTLSVVELKVLKLRMQQGMEEKARRGELRRLLTPGYVYNNTGKVVKDPDLRVQDAVTLIFRKFREFWSIRQTFKWFSEEKVLLPVNQMRGNRACLQWQVPSLSYLGGVLRNPVYAGAYVYGRRPTEMQLKNGRLVKRTGRLRTADEARVCIREHHEGYMDWETFEENQRMIRRQSTGSQTESSVATVRAGRGLLAGLLRCGHCGRKLYVRYHGRAGTIPRYLCKGEFDSGGDYCLHFAGLPVDRRFAEELLRVLSPLGLAASIEAMEMLASSGHDRSNVLIRQLQQLEYEVRRAHEQYDEVDPRNRLVAAELEKRWNAKLEEVVRVQAELESLEKETRNLSERERQRLTFLGQNFALVWQDARCPIELKKKMMHTAIEEVVAYREDTDTFRTLRFVVHWKGGCHTQFEVKREHGSQHRTATDDLDLIRAMAVRYGDIQIAQVLNKRGSKTGKGKRWTPRRVATARRNHGIEGRHATIEDPEIVTQGQAANECGVSPMTIRALVKAGILPVRQVTRWAPWEIRRADLASETMREVLEHYKKTRRLPVSKVQEQMTIFE